MIVSGCTGSFVVPGSLGCAEGPEPEVVMYFGSGRNSSDVYHMFGCFWWFAGVVFGAHHLDLLLYSCKWDSSVPIHIVLLLVVLLHWGFGCSCSLGSIFMCSLEFVAVTVLLVGGICQSFLNSKRLPDIFPALGQVVLAETGVFSNGGGMFPGIPSGEGF